MTKGNLKYIAVVIFIIGCVYWQVNRIRGERSPSPSLTGGATKLSNLPAGATNETPSPRPFSSNAFAIDSLADPTSLSYVDLRTLLDSGKINKAEYRRLLSQIGQKLKGATLTEWFDALKKTGSDNDVLALLTGACVSDPDMVVALTNKSELFLNGKVRKDSNVLDMAGVLYFQLKEINSPLIDQFLASTGDPKSVKLAGLKALIARDGIESALKEIEKTESSFSGNDRQSGAWIVSQQAKESGWEALKKVTDALKSESFPAISISAPIEAMASISPDKALAYVLDLPVSEKRGIALNGLLKTVALQEPDKALEMVTKIGSNRDEQVNALFGLYGAFEQKQNKELMQECAELLNERGIKPPY